MMDKFNYQNITEAEAEELERELSKKLAWFRKDLPTRWDRMMYKETADRLNNAWKKTSFWRLPDYFHEYDFPEKHHPENYGRYNLPVNVLASEPFYKYLESKLYLNDIENLKEKNVDSSRQELEKNKNAITSKIHALQVDFFREVRHVADQMQEVIQKNSHDSTEYEPFMLSQNGEITQQRIELIGRAEDTYRGVICGSTFATDYLLRDFIFVNHEIVDVLKDLSDKLLETSKTFLALQMIDEHFDPKQGRKITRGVDQKRFNQAVMSLIEKAMAGIPDFQKYIHQEGANEGKPNRSKIAKYIIEKGLHKIEENPLDKGLDPRTIDRWIKKQVEKITI